MELRLVLRKFKPCHSGYCLKTSKNLRGFLEWTYYCRFAANYGALLTPLTHQLKKDAFDWNDEAQTSIWKAKRSYGHSSSTRPARLYTWFIVKANVSSTRLGAVLKQKSCPISYFNQVLSKRAQLKPIYEHKLMAIILAIQRWRPYLLGCHFVVWTDQCALKFLLEQCVIPLDYQRWVTKLLGYDFEIQFKPDHENHATDALSNVMRLGCIIFLFPIL